MKNCPYCNSEILDEAVFCVHCKSSLSSNMIEETNSNIKRCPYCGNECDKNAVLCVKCGSSLENKVNRINKTFGKGMLIYIINLILCGFGAITLVINLFKGDYSFADYIIAIVNVIGAVLVLVGLIVGKKNKIPAIGYCISAVATVITIFYIVISYFDESIIVYLLSLIVSVVESVLVGLLYSCNKTLKKSWFIPIILCFVTNVLTIIINYDKYYYYYFYSDTFLIDIVFQLASIIGVAITCLNAKLNWCSEENKAE